MIAGSLLLPSASHSAENENIQALFLAINERLGFMEDVALYKAQNRVPVEDIERENTVLENSKTSAATQGINPQSMERFFVTQINAAKAIQYRFRAELLTRELPDNTVDLDLSIRPALDRLGIEIIRIFAQVLREGEEISEQDSATFFKALTSRHLVERDKRKLFEAMRQVRLD